MFAIIGAVLLAIWAIVRFEDPRVTPLIHILLVLGSISVLWYLITKLASIGSSH